MTVATLQARNYLHSAVMQIQPDIVEYLLSLGVEATQTAMVSNREHRQHVANMQFCIHCPVWYTTSVLL